MNKNPEELLTKKTATDILMQYHSNLKISVNFSLQNIKRTPALSHDNFVIVYKINDNGAEKIIRGSASTIAPRENGFNAMRILQEKGFNEGNFLVASNFVYNSDYNLLLYNDISGEPLINQLKIDNLVEKISLCAGWLSRMHKLTIPIKLQKYNFGISVNREALSHFYPDLAGSIEQIQEEKIASIKGQDRMLIHGDYQPNNIITKEQKIWVFDFNDVASDNPMIDLASFTAQLRIMLLRFGDIGQYEKLNDIFMNEYAKTIQLDNDMRQDLKTYQQLFYLRILASLSASLSESEVAKKNILDNVHSWYHES